MTGSKHVGRSQPSLPARLVARALALASDPAMPRHEAAKTLVKLGRGDPAALDLALRRVVVRAGDRPSHLTAGAVSSLRLALDGLASGAISHPAPGEILR